MPVAGAVLGEKLTGFDEIFKYVFIYNIKNLGRLRCNDLTQPVKEICIGKLVSGSHDVLEEA